MSFSEFLIANDCESYVQAMINIENIDMLQIIHEKLIEQLKLYYVIGGMPEVMKKWIQTKNVEMVYKLQQNIINAYIYLIKNK